MGLGLIFAISACFVWSAIFVIPQFLTEFTAVELVLGRYLIYGILSSLLFFRKGVSKMRMIPKKAWLLAFTFALLSNIFYYLGVIAGVRFASASLTVLVIGMSPIAIALYGNWHAREVSFKKLIFPSVWIFLGLVLINAAEVDWTFTTHSFQQYLVGVVGVVIALISWSWYAVHNARFLKRHPHIPSTDWTTVIGVCTFFWALFFGILSLLFYEEFEVTKFAQLSPETLRFFIGVGIMGVICSWLGCYLWNRASLYLPVSLMGPFLIFESLFGLLFVYSADFRLPTFLEILGVISMLGGIIFSILIFRRQKSVS